LPARLATRCFFPLGRVSDYRQRVLLYCCHLGLLSAGWRTIVFWMAGRAFNWVFVSAASASKPPDVVATLCAR